MIYILVTALVIAIACGVVFWIYKNASIDDESKWW